jgi:hypothetical protein
MRSNESNHKAKVTTQNMLAKYELSRSQQISPAIERLKRYDFATMPNPKVHE